MARLGSADWRAFGTAVVLRVTEPAALPRARAAVERELDRIDRTVSRFRPDSELSLANANAGRSLRVTPLFIEALELALRAAVLSEGDVDPTLGRALELIGYDRDHAMLDPCRGEPDPVASAPPALSALSARSRAGWRTVSVDPANGAFQTAPGVRLDLGATAKAWAADRAADAAARAGGCGALVSIGGDIATGGPAPDEGWRIHVTDDHRSAASAPGQTVSIRAGGLATSSTTVRRWRHGGRPMHHIIDPSSQAPARSLWRTVSAAAATCAEANIATTAAIIRSPGAIPWLAELGLPARLVDRQGRVTTVGGWPADPLEDTRGERAA